MKNINEKVIELWRQNLTQKEIGELLDRSQAGISLILKRLKLKRCKGEVMKVKTPVQEDYFLSINSEEKAYWLGFICADGSINKTNGKLSLVSKDKEVIYRFKNCIKSGHKISHEKIFDKRTKKRYERFSIQVTSHRFVKNLINLGITSQKSDVLFFPILEKEYYRHFIRGLFDGDGSISVKEDKTRFSLISTKEVLENIQLFIKEELDIKPLKLQSVTKNKTNVFKMYLYKDAEKLMNFLYKDSTIFLTRKFLKYGKKDLFSRR